MKLYNYFRSSASFRVRIALALKGIDYQYASLHLAKGEHLKPEFQAFAAEGLVPVLELDDGQLLTQSMAIIEYLDETHPAGAPLLPADALGRARVRALSQIVACEIHPLNNLRVLKYVKNTLGAGEEAKNTWYRHWVAVGLTSFERQLHKGPQGRYCHGDQPTMADCVLVPQMFSARRFNVDVARFPRVAAIDALCNTLPAFISAHPKNQSDFAP